MVHRVQVFQENFDHKKPKYMEKILTREQKEKENQILRKINNKFGKFMKKKFDPEGFMKKQPTRVETAVPDYLSLIVEK